MTVGKVGRLGGSNSKGAGSRYTGESEGERERTVGVW